MASSTYSATSRALAAGTLATTTPGRPVNAAAARSTPAPVNWTSSTRQARSAQARSRAGPTDASTTARAVARSSSGTESGPAANRIRRSPGGCTPTSWKSASGRRHKTSALTVLPPLAPSG